MIDVLAAVATAVPTPEVIATVIPPETPVMPPWGNSVLITLIVTSALGILQIFAGKLPGKFGQAVLWLVSIIGANIAHKK